MNFEISDRRTILKVDGRTVSWLNYEAEESGIYLIDTLTRRGIRWTGICRTVSGVRIEVC
ncbi:hypothetical protein [Geoglobus sp.]